MARARRILRWTAGTVGIVAAGVVIALFVLPWDWARAPLARRISDATHRGVAIDGAFRVHLATTTRLVAENIRIDNVPWGSRRRMAEIRRLSVSLYLPALLRGVVVIPELRLTEPDIALEKNQRGEANWTFANPKAAAVKGAVVPKTRSQMPVIERVEIEHGRLSYKDPLKGIDIDSRINTAIGGDPQHRELHLSGSGQFEGQPFRLAVEGGSILRLRDQTRPYPLTVNAAIGATQAAVDGTVTDPLQLSGLDLAMRLKGNDLAAMFPIFGIPLPHSRPYSIEGRLAHQGDRWIFHDFAGKVGDSDLSGNLSVARQAPRPRMTATVVSHTLDYRDLAGFIGGHPGQSGPANEHADRVLPDTPLAVDHLHAMDMSVHFNGEKVMAPHLTMDHLQAVLSIEDGRAVLDPFSVGLAQGTLAGAAVVDARAAVPAASVKLHVDQVKLADFFRNTPFADQTSGVVAGRVDLGGVGQSTAQILAHADGRVSLFMGEGRFSDLATALIGLDIGKALGLMATKDKPITVRCMVADFALAQGQGKADAVVLDTTASAITGEGTINFGTEALDLRLTPHPKTPGILSARSDILVGGTFKTPQVGVDPTAIAAKTTAAVALGALLTPLGALLPFIQLGLGHDSPCGELIENARSAHQQAGLPDDRPRPAER